MCRNHNRTGIKVHFDFKNAFFQNLENVTKIRQNPYLFHNLKITHASNRLIYSRKKGNL